MQKGSINTKLCERSEKMVRISFQKWGPHFYYFKKIVVNCDTYFCVDL